MRKIPLEIVAWIIIFSSVAFAVGTILGMSIALNECYEIGVKVLERSGFEVSPTIIQDIINRYGIHFIEN